MKERPKRQIVYIEPEIHYRLKVAAAKKNMSIGRMLKELVEKNLKD